MKKRIDFEIVSYGIYNKWDKSSKDLPRIKEFAIQIPAITGTEFGLILLFKKAKGQQIDYVIHHPDFLDSKGKPALPFEGSYFINSNEFQFYIGDYIWEPIDDKIGLWTIEVFYDDELLVRKEFNIVI
jgi:hypothetical protein